MKCPNCSLPQPDGPACVRCQTPLGRYAEEIKRASGDMMAPEKQGGGLHVPPAESVVGAIDELELGGGKPRPAATAIQAPPAKQAATPAPAAPGPDAPVTQKEAILKSAAPVPPPTSATPATSGVVSKEASPPTPAAMSMPVTTGHDLPGRHMIKAVGVVSSQVLVRVGADQLTSGSAVQSLAGTGAGNHLQQGVEQAFMALRANAAKVGGDAVVSAQVSYCAGVGNGMLLAVTGTAVKLAPAG